jgi:chromosome partitioning protein
MKTLTLANQKGGVGKSAVVCQFAYFLRDMKNLRVLVIDLDHQGNTSKAIRTSGLAVVSATTSSKLLDEKTEDVEDSPFLIIPADGDLLKKEKQADMHNRYANNLAAFLKNISGRFDVCIIDTNPNPDIRTVSALIVADFAISPIQLNQEALDGIGALYSLVKQIKSNLNKNLDFLGILPNLVEATPFQKQNFMQLVQQVGGLMIKMDHDKYASIKNRTAISESQAQGKPIWKLGKSSAVECWKEVKPVFEKISELIGAHHA